MLLHWQVILNHTAQPLTVENCIQDLISLWQSLLYIRASCNSFWLQIVYIHYFSQQYYYGAILQADSLQKFQLTMEYSNSVEAKQGTERSELVLPKSVHEDTMRYSIPIQAEEDVRNSMLVASVVYLNNTR